MRGDGRNGRRELSVGVLTPPRAGSAYPANRIAPQAATLARGEPRSKGRNMLTVKQFETPPPQDLSPGEEKALFLRHETGSWGFYTGSRIIETLHAGGYLTKVKRGALTQKALHYCYHHGPE